MHQQSRKVLWKTGGDLVRHEVMFEKNRSVKQKSVAVEQINFLPLLRQMTWDGGKGAVVTERNNDLYSARVYKNHSAHSVRSLGSRLG